MEQSNPIKLFPSDIPRDTLYKRFWSANSIFWLIAILHVIIWTVIPAAIRFNLPMDALEGFIWGQHIQLGYDRNPWLNAWLTRLALEMTGGATWSVYLFSQLCVLAAFFSVWQLGKKILSPYYAVIAVFMLEAIQYYSLAAIDFNDNVLELGLWPLTAYFLYQALKSQKLGYWIGVGIAGALAFMAKYYSAIFLFTLLSFIFVDAKARQSLRQPGFYVSLTIFTCISLPHFIWLFHYDFTPIRYALKRVNEHEIITYWDQIKHGLHFGLIHLGAFLGAVALSLFAYLGKTKNQKIIATRQKVASFDRKFLWFVTIGPLVITMILSAASGWRLHILWGTPLLSLWGLLWISYTQPKLTMPRLRIFVAAVLVVMSIFLTVYSISIMHHGDNSSANFPGQELAATATQIWQESYHTPLTYVAGERYLAGYISLYSTDKPTVYIGANQAKSPWVNHADFLKHGGIFVEPITRKEYVYKNVMKRFPNLIVLPTYTFKPQRADDKTKPIEVIIAIVPPAS